MSTLIAKASRTFTRVNPGKGPFLPGLRDDDEQVDVTRFSPDFVTQRFVADGDPATDDFILAAEAWEQLGSPERIRVTVEVV